MKTTNGIVKIILLIFYYSFMRWLPNSNGIFGFLWRRLRYLTCKNIFLSCGENVNIEHGSYFGSGKIKIGNNSGLGINSVISKWTNIGNNVLMGQDVIIYTRNHNFARIDIPIIEQGFEKYKPVIIEDNVWIGARVIILPGVHIGSGCVIGAGSVVTKSLPKNAVVGGSPAKVLKHRY